MKPAYNCLLLLALLLSACCMDDCNFFGREAAPTYLMDQDFKDYTLFPVGSYWIYASGSGEIDSVYLYRQDIGIDESRKIFPFNCEGFNQNLGSSYFADTLFGGGGVSLRSNDTTFYIYAERYLSNFLITNVQFFNQAKPGESLVFTSASELRYLSELDSYFIGKIEYTHVRAFENLIPTEARLPKKIFYARGIGIIRKELYNGQIWNLKRYFINK
jgi:hypothetical protein